MPGFIIDLDGTLYAGTKPIRNARAFIQQLEKHSYPYLLMTNNSSRTVEEIREHIATVLDIEISLDHLFTSSQATLRYVQSLTDVKRIYLIGQNGLSQVFREAGYELVEEQADAVVQGVDNLFSYDKLTGALRAILGGAAYILTNPDHRLPTESGLLPEAGSISAAIERASETKPVLIGKPSTLIMEYAMDILGLPAKDIWMVGDNLQTDIAGGLAAGCQTCLVLTGLATPDNVDALIAQTGIRPSLIVNDLSSLLSHIHE